MVWAPGFTKRGAASAAVGTAAPSRVTETESSETPVILMDKEGMRDRVCSARSRASTRAFREFTVSCAPTGRRPIREEGLARLDQQPQHHVRAPELRARDRRAREGVRGLQLVERPLGVVVLVALLYALIEELPRLRDVAGGVLLREDRHRERQRGGEGQDLKMSCSCFVGAEVGVGVGAALVGA